MARTYFFWDPLSDNILQERDESGAVTADYTTEPGVHGNVISQNRGGVESQFHFDPQGSTLALSDDNQNVTDTYAYSAFGEVTEHTGDTVNPFQYKGQNGFYRDDETGEFMAFGRVLSASEGRWLAATLTDLLNPFAFAGGNPVMFVAVVEEGSGDAKEAKKAPGGHASEGSVCSASPFTLPGIEDFDTKVDQSGDRLFKFNYCQCRSGGDHKKNLHGQDIVDIGSITTHLMKNKCCTIYLCGHQGGDKANLANLGGIYGYPPGKKEPIFILGPQANENEKKFKEAFEKNGCKDCVINIYSCGGAEYMKEEAAKMRENRLKIAELTGCKVCGSTGVVGVETGGILGKEHCLFEDLEGRPEWKPECVDSKNPIKLPSKPEGKSPQGK